jgi:flagellar hook-associated protein 1 FlgK
MALSGLLDVGASAILAQTAGVATIGRNTSNVNTPGYTRQATSLSSVLGGGVKANTNFRLQDELLASRERTTDGTRAFFDDLSAQLTSLDSNLNSGDSSIVDAIAALFGGITELAAAPADETLRAGVVSSVEKVASTFQRAASEITNAVGEANARIDSYADTASSLAGKIAKLNTAIGDTGDGELYDQRDQAARQLSELVGGTGRLDKDGKMRFVLESGAVLVDGDRANSLESSNSGRLEVVSGSHRIDITSDLSRGRIGAQLSFRDGTAARAMAELDQLAFDLSNSMNGVHRQHEGLDGTTGVDLFTPPAQIQGAASALAINADVGNDSRMLAGGFLELAALKDSNLAGGGTRTFTDEAIRTFSEIGTEAQRATSDLSVEQSRGEMLANLRDSVSGVSVEEELAKLAQFQHATEASARFISVVDDMMSSLIAQL